MVSQAGRITTLPIDIAAGDFDLGTDARGNRRLVYVQCGRSCDLRIATLDGVSKPIRNASSPHFDESVPTLWAGRLAWARKDVIYTRRLSDPTRVRSRRLGTVPRRTCPGFNPGCQGTHNRSVDELELHNGRLAELVSYPGGCGFGAARFGPSDRVYERTRGIRGLVGFSLLDGDRAYVLIPSGDPEGGEDALCPCRLEERTIAGWRVP
jgi:hypothetical protein